MEQTACGGGWGKSREDEVVDEGSFEDKCQNRGYTS